MISGKQILWGTLGWAFGGPIGGILGVIFAGSNDQGAYKQVKQSQAGEVILREELLGLPLDCFLVFGFDRLTKRSFVCRKFDLLGLRF